MSHLPHPIKSRPYKIQEDNRSEETIGPFILQEPNLSSTSFQLTAILISRDEDRQLQTQQGQRQTHLTRLLVIATQWKMTMN